MTEAHARYPTRKAKPEVQEDSKNSRKSLRKIGPQEETLEWKVADAMNADLMGMFLQQAGEAHLNQEVVMVLEGEPLPIGHLGGWYRTTFSWFVFLLAFRS